MIQTLREELEKSMGYPVHWVAINETEKFPCMSLRKSLFDSRHELKKRSGFALTGVELTIYGSDYCEVDDIAAKFGEKFDGFLEDLGDFTGVKIYVDDEDDDVYPSPDGSDDWIYARSITLRVHHKIAKG